MKVFFVLALLLLPPALAQSAPEPATIPVTLPVTTPVTVSAPDPATGPAAVADAAVREWLGREEGSLMALANLPPAEMCQELLALTQNPPPPRGTRVNFDNRLESPQDEPGRRVYTNPPPLGAEPPPGGGPTARGRPSTSASGRAAQARACPTSSPVRRRAGPSSSSPRCSST
jgi:hypothetical protein